MIFKKKKFIFIIFFCFLVCPVYSNSISATGIGESKEKSKERARTNLAEKLKIEVNVKSETSESLINSEYHIEFMKESQTNSNIELYGLEYRIIKEPKKHFLPNFFRKIEFETEAYLGLTSLKKYISLINKIEEEKKYLIKKINDEIDHNKKIKLLKTLIYFEEKNQNNYYIFRLLNERLNEDKKIKTPIINNTMNIKIFDIEEEIYISKIHIDYLIRKIEFVLKNNKILFLSSDGNVTEFFDDFKNYFAIYCLPKVNGIVLEFENKMESTHILKYQIQFKSEEKKRLGKLGEFYTVEANIEFSIESKYESKRISNLFVAGKGFGNDIKKAQNLALLDALKTNSERIIDFLSK